MDLGEFHFHSGFRFVFVLFVFLGVGAWWGGLSVIS